MAQRQQEWRRRIVVLGAGVLLCAAVGCKTAGEERQPIVQKGMASKPMGGGNQVLNPPSSPVYNNLAGGNPTGETVIYNSSPPHVNPPMTPGVPTNSQMPGVQFPTFNPRGGALPAQGQPTVQPAYGPGGPINQPGPGQIAPVTPTNFGPPPGGYPVNNQGVPNGPSIQQGPSIAPPMMPAPPANYPMPQVNPGPVSSNVPAGDFKVPPDVLPTSVTGLDAKGMPSGSQIMQTSATGGPSLAPTAPAESRTPVKVMDVTPRRVGEAPRTAAPDDVVEAPVTVIQPR